MSKYYFSLFNLSMISDILTQIRVNVCKENFFPESNFNINQLEYVLAPLTHQILKHILTN